MLGSSVGIKMAGERTAAALTSINESEEKNKQAKESNGVNPGKQELQIISRTYQ